MKFSPNQTFVTIIDCIVERKVSNNDMNYFFVTLVLLTDNAFPIMFLTSIGAVLGNE